MVRVLLVDDDRDDHLIIRDLLREIGHGQYRLDGATTYAEASAAIARREHDIYLFDYRLGERTGLDLLRESAANGVRAPMIMLTGQGDQEIDLEAMKAGAADYLVKTQLTAPILERAIRYAISRQQMEAQILVQDRMASIGLLASSLAHEIGTPLGVMRGRAELLAEQVRGDETATKSVDVIVAQIDRVSKLIRSLLNLARGEAHGAEGTVSLARVTREVADLVMHEFKGRQAELLTEVPEDATVSSGAEQLHQVILNMLVNSLHAIDTARDRGQQRPFFVRLTATPSANSATPAWDLRIEDNGCGISSENLRNLFRPFFTTKEIGVGTGLGLANSYRIIEAAGGSISVDSTEGKGTTFTLRLPKSGASQLATR